MPKERDFSCYSTIWLSANRSSHASRNSGVMCRQSFGQMSLHWEQKTHWATKMRTRFVVGRNSMAWAGQTFRRSWHPMHDSRS